MACLLAREDHANLRPSDVALVRGCSPLGSRGHGMVLLNAVEAEDRFVASPRSSPADRRRSTNAARPLLSHALPRSHQRGWALSSSAQAKEWPFSPTSRREIGLIGPTSRGMMRRQGIGSLRFGRIATRAIRWLKTWRRECAELPAPLGGSESRS